MHPVIMVEQCWQIWEDPCMIVPMGQTPKQSTLTVNLSTLEEATNPVTDPEVIE